MGLSPRKNNFQGFFISGVNMFGRGAIILHYAQLSVTVHNCYVQFLTKCLLVLVGRLPNLLVVLEWSTLHFERLDLHFYAIGVIFWKHYSLISRYVTGLVLMSYVLT